VSPQRADLVLAADVPDVELGVLVRDGLDVEADRGDRGDVLVELELVENGCTRVSGCCHAAQGGAVLVFPAASRPSIKSRISLDPKILFIIFDIEAPIVSDRRYAVSIAVGGCVCVAVRSWRSIGARHAVVLIAADSGTRG
jgi:hypothetical protein